MSAARYMIQLISPGGEVLTTKLRTKLGDYEGLANEIKNIDWEKFAACLSVKGGGYAMELANFIEINNKMFNEVNEVNKDSE